jgi:transporter family-2 protein
MKILLPLMAVAAGVATAIQAATNSGLARHIGIGAALVINTTIVLMAAVALWLAEGAPRSFFPAGTPSVFYVGGLFGFVIVGVGTFVFPRIGAAHAIAFMVFGQCLAALVVDHFGVLGMPHDPVTLRRVLGLALVAAGVAVLKL